MARRAPAGSAFEVLGPTGLMAMATSRDAVLRAATGSRKTMAQSVPLLTKASAILFEECGVCSVTAVQELELSLTDRSEWAHDSALAPRC